MPLTISIDSFTIKFNSSLIFEDYILYSFPFWARNYQDISWDLEREIIDYFVPLFDMDTEKQQYFFEKYRNRKVVEELLLQIW